MKLRFLLLILLLAVVAPPARPQQPQAPLTKGQVLDLVKFGMSASDLAEKIKKLGIDFEPADDYIQALRNAGAQDVVIQALREVRPKPLSRDQVGKLVAGGVPSERAAALVRQHGIDFLADEEYLKTLRLAGADEPMITAVREASAAALGELLVETSPGAEVFLDGALRGHASPQGELELRARLGVHALKVTLAARKDFEQIVTLSSVQATKIEARLVDAPGSIRLRSLAGSSISLDGASRGSTDANGELVLANVPPGPHELRVSAPEKREYIQNVTVIPGQQSLVVATLMAGPTRPGTVRENPQDGLKYVWIPPGSFEMGCSPGDHECTGVEKPHPVTLTRGFWLGQTPVTVGAYKRFAGATARHLPRAPRFNGGWANSSMPIVNVSWNDAHDYCAWAGGRLPTEAEWEYAARGGSTEARYGNLADIAWYPDNAGKQAHEVAEKRANGFGLYDILGNVSEWMNDWYDDNYYQNSPPEDPPGPTSGQTFLGGPGKKTIGPFRSVRGGSWANTSFSTRVSARNNGEPGKPTDYTGFRCGEDVSAP